MKRFFRTLTAAVLSVALLSTPAFAGYYPDKAHTPLDYAEMSWTEFDETLLTQALDELESLAQSKALQARTRQVHSQAARLYRQVLEGYDALYTQMTLAMIRYDGDYTDADASQAYTQRLDRLTVLFDRCLTVLQALARSPHADILERDGGQDWADALYYYEPMTGEELSFFQQETALVTQYEQLLNSDYDPGDMARLYLELVEVRTALARLYGYDSYADYAYAVSYSRDYTPREITAVEDTVKAGFPQLLSAIGSAMEADFDALYDLPGASGQQRLDEIGAYIGLIHPELEEAFSFLREHHLYDLDEGEAKLPLGYTVELPSYGSAFIFDAPYGSAADYATVIHEFGHFNNSFHITDRILWAGNTMDVSEIQSQALELLFTEYAGDIFGELGPAFRWYQVYSILSSVLDGYLYNEFERAVYADPDVTAEELSPLFLSIADSYGGGYEENDWMEVTHLFQSPFYYVSYGTSALSSLDIWLTSLTHRAQAVDAYMTISALPTTVSYGEAVEQAGLRDIFDESALAALARELGDAIEAELGVKADLPAMGRPRMGVSTREEQIFTLVLAACCAAAFLGSMGILALVLRRRKRRLMRESGFSPRSSARPREDPWD